MHILSTSVTAAQPDYVALGMILALLLFVAVLALRKAILLKKGSTSEAEPILEETPVVVAPGTAGELKLHDVDPKTAAMLMAIIADRLGKPLNELRFISIKEVK